MKQQINSLTATRAIAAIMVYIFHFGRDIYPFNKLNSVFGCGNISVSYFFVLSGFVLFISYFKNKFTWGGFLAKRLIRIAPAYFIALGISVLLYFFFYKMLYSAEFMKQLISCIFFFQFVI